MVKVRPFTKGGVRMDSTNEFVKKVVEQQQKQKKNQKRQGKGHPEFKLPNKQH